MNELKFNYKSGRSEKARISIKFTKNWLFALSICMIVLIVVGINLLVLGMAIGWAVIGFAAVPAMIVEWYNGELKNLVPVTKLQSIDDILSVDILGHLSHLPTPR